MKIHKNSLRKQIVVDSLLNDMTYHIEFNGHLTNHNKHAMIALHGLGASEEKIKSYYDAYAAKTPYGYPLEKAKTSQHTITEDNWQYYLGKRTSFSSYCDFFDIQEKKLGMHALLKHYVPLLLAGWAGALTHATIHLGWALDVNHRLMIIEGLAYMAFSYVSCHPEKISSFMDSVDIKNKTAIDSLLYIANVWENNAIELHHWVESLIAEKNEVTKNIHPELMRSGLQYKVARLLAEGHPLVYTTSHWIDAENNTEAIWRQLHYVATLLYMAYPGNFLLLHLLTSLHAMEHIANSLPVNQQQYTARCFWIGMLCILFSRAEFPKTEQLESLNATYHHAFDRDEILIESIVWKDTIDRALCEEEEHNPKLVYVLRRMWKISGYQTIFHKAATFFTTTPELPVSFEKPPVI